MPYANEKELQELLADNPVLLAQDDATTLTTVKREMNLDGAGMLDLLLVDSEGRPTVVEVKLGCDVRARREVVGQIFD